MLRKDAAVVHVPLSAFGCFLPRLPPTAACASTGTPPKFDVLVLKVTVPPYDCHLRTPMRMGWNY